MQMYARLREEPEEASDKSDAKETADASTSKTAGCEKKAAKQFDLNIICYFKGPQVICFDACGLFICNNLLHR